MLKFSGFEPPKDRPFTVLDVGCGIGGTSRLVNCFYLVFDVLVFHINRYLAKKFGSSATVTGITLSPVQVNRGTTLAKEQGIENVKFQITDALDMKFPDNSFDLVWACESGEHMPDKKKYIEEMTRVLKPGGKIVVATWCQRDDTERPFNSEVCILLKSSDTLPFMCDRKREC